MSGGCVEVIRACRFGFAGGCGDELKTMGELVVERVRKAEMIAGIFAVCGEAAEEVRGAKRRELSRREIEQMRRVR